MIDLVLQATTQQTIYTLLSNRGLVVQKVDMTGQPVIGEYVPVPGFDFCWWAQSGKFMTAKAVPDPNNPMGPPTTPATFLAGFVMIARITDPTDALPNPPDGEQWSRSKVAQLLKDNGVLGSFGGIPCYTYQSVRMFRAQDVFAWVAAHNVPGHEWAGGNAI